MRAVAAFLALTCLLAVVVAPAGAVHDTGRTFQVFLEDDGDATLAVERVYDLSVPAERARFETLRDNATVRAERVTAFTTRLEGGMEAVRESTERDPTLDDADVEFAAGNGTGTVTLSVPVSGLARVEPRAVVLTQPSGSPAFALAENETLVVHGPAGYVRGPLRPSPEIARRSSALWGHDSDLSGFAARFEQPPTPTSTPEGWGAFSGAAFFALVPAALVAAAVRRRDE